ncbi:MAG: hypothetical protein HY796_12650 [Elusimicrobia bacterium]|nr:hypothetical protein [Elusimicrobiota bacterium]
MAHNPRSNANNAVGIADIVRLMKKGVLMENKKLKLNIDEEAIAKKSAELAKKLWSRF